MSENRKYQQWLITKYGLAELRYIMKKIVFFVQWMLCGGVENALISLGKELRERGNNVTICMIESYGEFINKIPDGIRIQEIPMPDKVRKYLPVGGTKIAVRRAIYEKDYIKTIYLIFKHEINCAGFAELNIDFNKIPLLDEKYDIAVNFHIHSPFLVRYLEEKVEAKKKFTWIHNDFSTTRYNIRELKKYLDCVDQFFCVSQQLMDEFVGLLPEYRTFTRIAHNIVPIDEIRTKADAFYPDEYKNNNQIKILTVGRLEEQKGYNLAIRVANILKSKGLKFQWYVLGNGTLHDKLANEIKREGIEDCFYLLGIRRNPYPYFKNCDIYVQTSMHEGYATTVTEAKALYRPIVTTDVSGVREQLIDGVNGEITTFTEMDIADRIGKLIADGSMRDKYSNELFNMESSRIENWIDEFEREGE